MPNAGVLYFALVVARLMLDIEMEWTPSGESLKSSGWSASLLCRTPDRWVRVTSRQRTGDTTICSRTVRGFDFGSVMEFAADK
jgi:hypothetical protein